MKVLAAILGVVFSANCVAQCGVTGDTLEINSAEDWIQLAGCDSVFGSLFIHDWDISDLSQMQDVIWVEENLTFNENISLLSDNQLTNLEYVGGDLTYSGNFTLQEISGLQNLNHLGGSFILDGNITLVTIGQLGTLNSINGDLIIHGNHVINDLSGLSGVETLGGSLEIGDDNLVLNDFSGLSNLMEIEGDVYLTPPSAISVDGFNALNLVEGNLTLENMPLLANVNGFENLEAINGSLTIQNNGSLVQIDGLGGLNSIGENLNIHDNPSLFFCCGIWPLVVDGSVSGEVNIHDNSMDCSSVDTIDLDCWVGIEEVIPTYSLDVFDTRIRIQSSEKFDARLLTSGGDLVSTCESRDAWETSMLPAGIYLIEIRWDGTTSVVEKLVIDR